MGEAALVEAQTSAPPAHTPKYSRLTRSDIGTLLKLKRDGLTQVEIAKRLGCHQSTISKWWDEFEDTRDLAKGYLAGASLRMAQNIVKKGRAADHVKALEGLEVLSNQDVKGGLTIVIGGHAQVQVNVGGASQAEDA